MNERPMSINAVGITKRFGAYTALQDVDLAVRAGELVALLGPSGSGKTTLLRIIAGLEWPDAGDVQFEGRSMVSRTARERHVGFVFQHYALFRHMSVFENVAFGLRVRPRAERPSNGEIQTRVHELLQLVQIDWLAQRYPAELSGGQRQRVALARALAIEPRVLLLDEPFGALDAKVRKELRRWLRRLHEQTRMTSIFVTHDQEEALEVADRVVVMSQGKIEQIDTPEQVYENPANPFVYQFLGNVNQLTCEVRDGRPYHPGILLKGSESQPGDAKTMALYVRPHEIEIEPSEVGDAVVRFIAAAGPTVRLEVEAVGEASVIQVELPREKFLGLDLSVGSRVTLSVAHGRLFPDLASVAS
jgi:sulfate transport system ATP-binding protein